MNFLLLIFWRLRNKRDGFGLKSTFKWWGIDWIVFAPALGLLYIWEGFTDLEYYVAAIRVLIFALSMNLLVVATMDWPVYLSFFESAQHNMSSISADPDIDEESQVEQVLEDLAEARESGAAVELESPSVVVTGQAAGEDIESSPAGAGAGAGAIAGAGASDDGPEVFSSATLALSLEDILLNPLYSRQMISLTRHLVGEFNVEGLLFFLRVLRFQKIVKAHDTGRVDVGSNSKEDLHSASDETTGAADKPELSRFSSSSGDGTGTSSGHGGGSATKTDDWDTEVAWRALLLYFEFLAHDSPAQVRFFSSFFYSIVIRHDMNLTI